MIRGTTPTHTFRVSVDLREADVVWLTYSQREKVVVEKSKADMEITENTVTVKLTQEDTLKFKEDCVYAQIRARFSDGTAIACPVRRTTAQKVLKEGII